MPVVRHLALALGLAFLIVGLAVLYSRPAPAAEWLGGIGASLRYTKAPAGEYHYGKATVTFNGKRVTKLVTADGHVVDHRKPKKR